MSPTGRLNLIAFRGHRSAVGVNGAAFSYRTLGSGLQPICGRLLEGAYAKPAVKAGDRTISECLGVSDFYSVHLTTYFLPDSDESAGGPTDDLSKYDEYCDRVPGTGKVIFSVTLMEKDARNESVALSFYQVDTDGGLKQINALPSRAAFKRLCDVGRERSLTRENICSSSPSARRRTRRTRSRCRSSSANDRRVCKAVRADLSSLLARLRARRFCRHRRKPVT